MSKENPWTYEHWHRFTPRKTIKTKHGYEMLERCRGCGELKSTLIKSDQNGSRTFASKSSITIKES